jgi:uroporphyrinogen decarboxylase
MSSSMTDSGSGLHPTDAANIAADTANSRFLRACRRQSVDTTPIWLMRQAGRYMAEYRALREKYGIMELIKTPELACTVAMQPIQTFGWTQPSFLPTFCRP